MTEIPNPSAPADDPLPELSTREAIRGHGATGSLLLALRRYHYLGWLFAGVLLLYHAGYVLIDQLQPVPVLAVDETGRLLGRFEYLDERSRTSDEYLGGGKGFLTTHLSANSATIFEDAAAALNMMAPDLAAQYEAQYLESGYLSTIAEAQTRSYLKFERAELLSQEGGQVLGRFVGQRFIIFPQAEQERLVNDFDISLELAAAPRTHLGTSGVRVLNIIDN